MKYLDGQADLNDLFLLEARRKVAKDRTVSLNGLVYEVDASLVGATVTLRFEPTTQERGVQVWHDGRKVHDAKVVDLYANCFARRDKGGHAVEASTPPPPPPPPGLRLAGLRAHGGEEG